MAADSDALGDRTPLVFIHGINQDAVPGLPQYTAFNNLASLVASTPALHSKYKPYFVSYWSNVVSVQSLGGRLRDVLDAMSVSQPAFGARPIVIVAHSMGGLVSRSFMQRVQQEGAFASALGGDRALRLVTLGTPHHGTPAANGPSRDHYGSGSMLLSLLQYLDNSFWNVSGGSTWPSVNRSDLRWDNFDGLLDYANNPDTDYWLDALNSDSTYDSKLIAYAGQYDLPSDVMACQTYACVISRCGSAVPYCPAALILYQFGLASDGIVPVKSAHFDNSGNTVRPGVIVKSVSGYDHTAMHEGHANDNMLFPMIIADLDRVSTISWSSQPPSSVTSGQSYSVAWRINGGTHVTHSNVHWDTVAAWRCSATANPACSTTSSVTEANPGTAAAPYSATFNAPSVTTATNYSIAAHAEVDGHETWSAFLTMRVLPPNVSPPPPALITPGLATIPGSSVPTLAPTFYWQSVLGADAYDLYLDDSFDTSVYHSATLAASSTSHVYPGSLINNASYSWSMRAHNAAGWSDRSPRRYFTVSTGQTPRDFSVSAAPGSLNATSGATVSYIVSTSTVSGTPQNITLSAGNVPANVTVTFNQSSITSGATSTLTIATTASTPAGTYVITISGQGETGVSHTTSVALAVSAPVNGDAAICLTPPSVGFSDQMVANSDRIPHPKICSSCRTGASGCGRSFGERCGPPLPVKPSDCVHLLKDQESKIPRPGPASSELEDLFISSQSLVPTLEERSNENPAAPRKKSQVIRFAA